MQYLTAECERSTWFFTERRHKKSCDDAEIDNIRIYDEKNEITYDELVKILEYIYSHDMASHYDFINISMGITRVGCTSALENICCRLKSVGTIMISAFDNEGLSHSQQHLIPLSELI